MSGLLQPFSAVSSSSLDSFCEVCGGDTESNYGCLQLREIGVLQYCVPVFY